VVDAPVSLLDIVPTALALAGVLPPRDRELDGVSLAPLLRGESGTLDRDALYWRHGTNWAIRAGTMKLIGFAGHDGPLLFDLASEAGESVDLAASRPLAVAELSRRYREWEAKMVAPLWDSSGSIWISLDDLLAGKPMIPLRGQQPGAVELP
jgi:arylsulfatase A-like enzyme